MQRYELVLRKIIDNPGNADDGNYSEVIVVSGRPSTCLAVIPSIMDELGGFPNGPGAVTGFGEVTYHGSGDEVSMQADADRAEAEQDAADEAAGKPKRKRRTKAEMDAARAAEAAPVAATDPAISTVQDDATQVPETMPAEPMQSGGVVAPFMTPASPQAPVPAAPYNPFA